MLRFAPVTAAAKLRSVESGLAHPWHHEVDGRDLSRPLEKTAVVFWSGPTLGQSHRAIMIQLIHNLQP